MRPGRGGRGPGHPRAPGRRTKAAPAAFPESGRPPWGARAAKGPRGSPGRGRLSLPGAGTRSRAAALRPQSLPPASRGSDAPPSPAARSRALDPAPRAARPRTVTPTVQRGSGAGGGAVSEHFSPRLRGSGQGEKRERKVSLGEAVKEEMEIRSAVSLKGTRCNLDT